jgi:hypothetical protein
MRRRQPAQVFVMAALATTAMIGTLSMVVDAGVYFVIQRQLQNAADAAALAAVWYVPACFNQSAWQNAGCQATAPTPTAPGCPPPLFPSDTGPCTQAWNQLLANQSVALSLCAGPNLPAGTIPITMESHPGPVLVVPAVSTYVVTFYCDAPHWFARIFPSVALTMHISVSASAALGWLGPNGQLQGGATQPAGPPPAPLVARLLATNV